MFTRDIRTQVQLTKSGVRWDGLTNYGDPNWGRSESKDATRSSNDNTLDQKIEQAKRLLSGIADNRWFSEESRDKSDLEELKKIMAEIDKKNANIKNALMNAINQAITEADDDGKGKLQALKEEWEKEYTKVAQSQKGSIEDAKDTIRTDIRVGQYIDQTRGDLQAFQKRYENKLSFNDVMSILKKNPAALDTFTQADTYSTDSSSLDTPLTKFLDEHGYVSRNRLGSGENIYRSGELSAILELRDALKSEANKMLLNNVEYQQTVKVKPYNPDDIDSLLQRIANLSGDGLLTAKNTRARSSNVVFAFVQKVFDLGDATNLHIEGELPLYNALKNKVGNIDDLVLLLEKATGHSSVDIHASMLTEEGFKTLVHEFQRAHLTNIAKVGSREIAGHFDEEANKKYQIEKAKELVRGIEATKEQLKKEGFVGKLKDAFTRVGIDPDGATIDAIVGNTALKLYELNPQFVSALGAHTSVTRTTTNTTTLTHHIIENVAIHQDYLGNEIDRTVTHTDGGTTSSTSSHTETRTRVQPTLFIGFHQDVLGFEKKGINANIGAGAGAVFGVDGIKFPFTVSGNANFTVKDTNAELQTSGIDGNWVIGGRMSLSKDLLNNGRLVPSFGIDINPNDRIQAMKDLTASQKEIISLLEVEADGNIDTRKIDARLADLEKKYRESNNKSALGEVRLMQKLLVDLKTVLTDTSLNIPAEKKALTGITIKALQDQYLAAIRSDMRGFHLAGINISFIPSITGIFLGLNIQHIQQHVRVNEKANVAGQKNVIIDSTTSLPNGVSFKDGKITVDKTKNPNLILDTGLVPDQQGVVVPGEGYRLIVQHQLHGTMDGASIEYTVISQELAPRGERKEIISPSAGKEEGDAKMVYTKETARGQFEKAKTTQEKIFALSRGNKAFAQAMQYVVNDQYDKAEAILKKTKSLKPYADALAKLSPDEKKGFLDTLLYATSGSRITRKFEREVSAKQYDAGYNAKSQRAFARRLEEYAKGQKVSDKKALKEMQAEHTRLAKEIDKAMEQGGKFVPASQALEGVKDISGMITFSQINTEGKLSVRGMKRFHGDITILDKVSDIKDTNIKNLSLEEAKKSGVLKTNMESTNEYIKKYMGESAPQFTEETYASFLRTGVAPAGFEKVSFVKPRFMMARVALEGVPCLNDAYLIGYPRVTGIEGVKNFVEQPADNLPRLAETLSEDTATNAGGQNAATLGLSFTEVTNNVVQNIAQEVTITQTNTTITKDPPPEEPPPVDDGQSSTPGVDGETPVDTPVETPVEQPSPPPVEGGR